MGVLGSVKTSIWREFLKAQGLAYSSTEGSHEKWIRAGLRRPIIFQGGNKEIPEFHIRTNLKTLGISLDQFLEFLEK